MNDSIKTEIIEYEARLRQAMLRSDLEELDELLSSELIFTDHLGHLITKEDDLEAHSTGTIKVEAIAPSEEKIWIAGDVAIISVRVHILGTYAGVPSEADLRFTRLWVPTAKGTWQIVAGHSSIVT